MVKLEVGPLDDRVDVLDDGAENGDRKSVRARVGQAAGLDHGTGGRRQRGQTAGADAMVGFQSGGERFCLA